MVLKNGSIFTHLTVKRFSHKNESKNENFYVCSCICGREVTLKESELTEGVRTACDKRGCYANMLGKQYGEWTPIEINKNFQSGKIKARCSCGIEKMVNASDLRNKKSMSCGHTRNANYKKKAEVHIGEQWGWLTVLEPVLKANADTKKSKYYYKCRCKCGQIVTVAGQKLWSGHTKSCGCMKSSANEQLAAILTREKINFQREYRFEECKDKAPLPFDFAVFNEEGELVGLIENNGEQHYLGVGRGFYTQAKLETISYHDFLKRKFCEDNQIPLLIIPFQFFGKKMEDFLFSSNLWASLV